MKGEAGAPLRMMSAVACASAVLGAVLAATAGSPPLIVGVAALAFAALGALVGGLALILAELRDDAREDDRVKARSLATGEGRHSWGPDE